jgi:hypothetical protein
MLLECSSLWLHLKHARSGALFAMAIGRGQRLGIGQRPRSPTIWRRRSNSSPKLPRGLVQVKFQAKNPYLDRTRFNPARKQVKMNKQSFVLWILALCGIFLVIQWQT